MLTKTLSYLSSRISYRVTGKGKPVVLLHGFGEDGNIWQNQVEFLQKNFLLIVPDLPGSGNSTRFDHKQHIHIDAFAEAIHAILIEEKIKCCTMMGHSMGGYITLAFAEKFPTLLNAFGLVHSTAFADNEEKKAARLKSIEFIKKSGAYEFLKTSIPGLFSHQWLVDNERKIKALIEKGKYFSAEALIQYYKAMMERPNRISLLKNTSLPVLFIIGEQDNAIPFRQSLQQCKLPAYAHLHILRNSGHMGIWEENDTVNYQFLQFLQLL